MLFGPTATVASVEPQAAAMQTMLAARDSAEADDRTLQMMSATDAGRAQVKAWTRAANAKVAAQLMYDDMTTDLRPELSAIAAPFTMLYPLDASAMPEAMVDDLNKGAAISSCSISPKPLPTRSTNSWRTKAMHPVLPAWGGGSGLRLPGRRSGQGRHISGGSK